MFLYVPDLMKTIAAKWRTLPENQKQIYQDIAEKENAKYLKELVNAFF